MYDLKQVEEILSKIGFKRDIRCDIPSKYLYMPHNIGYIGAYNYDGSTIHLYDKRMTLLFSNRYFQTSLYSFQSLLFEESVNKLYKIYYKELRQLKINNILEN